MLNLGLQGKKKKGVHDLCQCHCGYILVCLGSFYLTVFTQGEKKRSIKSIKAKEMQGDITRQRKIT